MKQKQVIYDCITQETKVEEVEIEDIIEEFPNIIPEPTLEERVLKIEEHSVEIIATTFDIDYRLLELGWILEDKGIINTHSILNNENVLTDTINLTRYEQAKILILSNKYNKERMTYQLTKYYERKCLEEDEFNELIELMNNNNL